MEYSYLRELFSDRCCSTFDAAVTWHTMKQFKELQLIHYTVTELQFSNLIFQTFAVKYGTSMAQQQNLFGLEIQIAPN